MLLGSSVGTSVGVLVGNSVGGIVTPVGVVVAVLVFVFRAESESRSVRSTDEGTPEWICVESLAEYPLVDDLNELVPRVLAGGPVFYGHYSPRADGLLQYRFTAEQAE